MSTALSKQERLNRLYSQELISFTGHHPWSSLQWCSGALKQQYQKVPEKEGRGKCTTVTVRNDAGLLDLILKGIQSLNKCLSAYYGSGAVLRTRHIVNSRLDPCLHGAHVERVFVVFGPADEPPSPTKILRESVTKSAHYADNLKNNLLCFA